MGDKIILPNLHLQSRVNQHWYFSGIDQFDCCRDKSYFKSYPHNIEYVYNSRGFRDQEWPQNITELKQAVWCVGDSFTVGLGSPLEHTWPARLSALSQRRTINVSMDGASNDWIARTIEKIINSVNPDNIVIMWSYTHRRELDDQSLSDENRRVFESYKHANYTAHSDLKNFLSCCLRVKSNTTLAQFAVPNFHDPACFNLNNLWERLAGPDWPQVPSTVEELMSMPQWILDELKNLHNCLDLCEFILLNNLIQVPQLDLARDGHHFDLLTADWVAQRAIKLLN